MTAESVTLEHWSLGQTVEWLRRQYPKSVAVIEAEAAVPPEGPPTAADLADDDDEYMCPNCVTPWKCNGPHLPPAPPEGPGDLRTLLAQAIEYHHGLQGSPWPETYAKALIQTPAGQAIAARLDAAPSVEALEDVLRYVRECDGLCLSHLVAIDAALAGGSRPETT